MSDWSLQDSIPHSSFMTYLLEGFVDNVGVLEVIIGKPVELAAKVSNIDTAQGIHL